FTDANPAGSSEDFAATIDWGDGQVSTGTISADPVVAGQFVVSGTNLFADRGTFPVHVTVTDAGGATVNMQTTARVTTPVTAAGTTFTAQAQVSFSAAVATILDANPDDGPGDFTATIDWGDGHSSSGLVTLASDNVNDFVVLGSTTYADAGS